MKIFMFVGARPNFIKLAPVFRRFSKHFNVSIVHTGQHYDYLMSKAFFEELNIPEPDYYLNAGSGTHAQQTAKIMVRSEELLMKEKPDWVFVFGDVNSTLAVALSSSKLGIRIAHVEAGLRSGDMSMPEEINRIITDRLSELLFVSESDAVDNLLREGIPSERIHFVGNTMIETLIHAIPLARSRFGSFGLEARSFALLTLHRPSNVDDRRKLGSILSAIDRAVGSMKVIFPAHPRTKAKLEGLEFRNMIITEPMKYLDFISLQMHARMVLTDSGGVQEESTYLGIPCLTLRNTTERPITVKLGTNRIVGTEPSSIERAIEQTLKEENYDRRIPWKWDEYVSLRILEAFRAYVA